MRSMGVILACCRLLALEAQAEMSVWPDYLGVTMPPNVAPLNFRVKGVEGAIRAEMRAPDGRTLVTAASGDGVVAWPLKKWREFLASTVGQAVELSVQSADARLVVTNVVSAHPLDRFLTYRLISPSYRNFREMGIYRRDLTTYSETRIYNNLRVGTGQCVNCHTYNQGRADEYLFHLRGKKGGTRIVSRHHGTFTADLQADWMFAPAQYPAWHPSGDFVAFSVNETKQAFYADNPDRIEVFDLRSDLALYDLATREILPIETTNEILETFPTWSPDGTRLYTARARTSLRDMSGTKDDRFNRIQPMLKDIYYDLAVRRFDLKTRRFSEPETVIDGQESRLSVTQPRLSPDGRWLVFTVGPYGSFHVWHKAADLWMLDLETRTIRRLDELNGSDSESYHCFSHDGRWLVFSSRRDDGTFTRPYFAAFDAKTGRFSKPFLLPVEHPDDHFRRMKSYNIPEFSEP